MPNHIPSGVFPFQRGEGNVYIIFKWFNVYFEDHFFRIYWSDYFCFFVYQNLFFGVKLFIRRFNQILTIIINSTPYEQNNLNTIYVITFVSKLSSSKLSTTPNFETLVQLFPWPFPQAATQLNPFLRQDQQLSLHGVFVENLQLHLITFNNSGGPGSKIVSIGP